MTLRPLERQAWRNISYPGNKGGAAMHRDFDPDHVERIVGAAGILLITLAAVGIPFLGSLAASQ